jgi:phosphatidylethanolamine/phosphatidyl-N-methylethanolamine N-methyltransferase
MVMDIRSPNSAKATSSLTSQEAEPRRNRVRDNLSFLKLWLRKPASLGAMLPSSKSLASAMAEQIDPSAPGAVIELGGGTGSITAALLDSGIAPGNIVVLEREAALCRLLRKRFPEVRVMRGDARDLARLLARAEIHQVKTVVSGLPLLSMPLGVERAVIAAAFKVLPEDGALVQFTYGPRAPVSRAIARGLDIVGERADWVLDNLPPAAVWHYRRRAALPELKRSA